MAQIIELPFKSKYTPIADFQLLDHISETCLLQKVRPYNPCDRYLWVSIEGFFNGTYLYILPTDELQKLITSRNIYNNCYSRDVYLKIIKNASGKYLLHMQYQQILGSYCLTELSPEEVEKLKALKVVNNG